MPVTPANFLSLSLSYLADMIADCQTWRSLVNAPDKGWAALADDVTAETGTAAAALLHITEGVFEDDPDHADYISKPRAMIRHLNEYDVERASTTGFNLNGALMLVFEIPVPTIHRLNDGLGSFRDAYRDVMNKIGGVIVELSQLPQQAGYLHLRGFGMGPTGLADPKDFAGELFFASEWLVQFVGGP